PEVYKKIIGMQMLVEGLAMGAFSNGFRYNRDPLARKLFQLVMTDEAFHHKFGKIWADRTVPQLSQSERDLVEDWTAHCAQKLLFDRGDPRQQAEIYGRFGLDPDRVIEAIMQRRKERDPTRRFKGETNIFRVLIKTLFNAGLITERTRGFYAAYVDMDELAAEGTRMPGDDIAEEGIRYLQEINFKGRARPVSIAAE
ncbi:MAG: ferritin-like domain-containing protein, partial [Alphaproteobacteria bacterium]|nr:ferritin-like domain-containing protein [Alphaproteobacteria bacterium]